MTTTRPVASVTSTGLVERLDLGEGDEFDALHQQLGDAITADQVDRLARIQVHQADLDLASITGIDGARRVDDGQPRPRSQTRTGMNETDCAERECDRDTGADNHTLPRRDRGVCGDVQVDPRIACVRANRKG